MSHNAPYDVQAIRADFPVFDQQINGRPLAYLDSAASAQKPRQVIDAMTQFMQRDYANVHRGLHTLSMRSTDAYEAARARVARFINAGEREVVFTKGATEAINLVAATYGRQVMAPGKAIMISGMEHHANIVPWQMLAQERGLELLVIPHDDAGVLDMAWFEQQLAAKDVGLVAVAHVSNVMGTVNPVEAIIAKAHAKGVPVLLDACQSVTHFKVDVKALDVDFLAFSAHKLYGPTGLGILYGKSELLQAMPPYQGGGDMIDQVRFSGTTYAEPPLRFEAGTPAIIETVGLTAALDWVEQVGMDKIAEHEAAVLAYATHKAQAFEGMEIIGQAPNKVSVLSFHFKDMHAHDLSTILDQYGVAVRAGHHCAQPLMERFGVTATARASFAAYSTFEEVDQLFDALSLAREMLV